MSQYKKPLSPVTTEALELICDANFHRVLHLPATSSHPHLRVTYATTSNFDDASLPVIYYCGPMLPSRYHLVGFDHLAKETGVRIICIDRPGVGGTPPVSLDQRIPFFVHVLPELLRALSISHVSLVSHSAGTIYLLNTLAANRSFLHPTKPYVALMAPWVSTTASQTALTSFLDKLPSVIVGGWTSLAKFAVTRVMPATNWSGEFFTAFGELMSGPTKRSQPGSEAEEGGEGRGDVVPGLSKELSKEIVRLQVEYMMKEEIKGSNDEARVCLKKESVKWEACDDYKEYLAELIDKEKQILSQDGSQKLKVRAFFAESDFLIGQSGQKYFDDLWTTNGVADCVDYEGLQLPGTDHDSIVIDLQKGALRRIFEEIHAIHATA